MPAGRPTKYSSDVLYEAQQYLEMSNGSNMQLPTIEGLALHLGVDDTTLNNWANEVLDDGKTLKYPEFFATIKDLKAKQKNQLMNDGMYGGKEVNSTMAIFLLKANHGMIETEKRILAGDEKDPLKVVIEDFTE